jgi:hypothetical protein
MNKIKELYSNLKVWLTNRWVAFVCVALVVSLFLVWYGAWWSLFIAIPILYDFYITKRIAQWHKQYSAKHAWWRTVWAVWCALVFAVIVGVLIYMIVFKWNTSAAMLLVVCAAVFGYALWNELKC